MRVLLSCVLVALVLPSAASAQASDVPVRLMLLGDASFVETERSVPDGFMLGQVVGHMNASLSPRLLLAAEGTLTPTAGVPTATLERLFVRYDVSDWLKISGGRFHTPISWWNTAYHHGSWLHSSISRPRAVAFGTWVLPVHFLGVLAEGALHGGPLIVVYEAGVGNGRQQNPTTVGDAGDDDGSLATVGGLRLRSLAIPGAEFGAHVYVDRIPNADGARVDERIWSAHVALQGTVEMVAEYALIRHGAAPGSADAEHFDTHARYAHLGVRLPAPLDGLLPYVRWESIEPAAEDPVFDPAAAPTLDAAYDALVAGVRWDVTGYAALKAEYRDERTTRAGERDDGRSFLLNVSFVIPNLVASHGPGPVAVH